MSADPFRHSLIHVFLEEELGDQSPPDLSQAIFSKAYGAETSGLGAGRRVWPRWSAGAALAAAVVIALVAWLIMPAQYPGLTISGDYQLGSGNDVQRGSTISTQDGSAVLELGGYCRVEIQPWTTLRIDGSDYREELFVEIGTTVCSVDSDIGRFAVLSELGSASAKGTKFTVRVAEPGGRRQMWVKVTEGSVEVSDGSVRNILQAGQERTIITGETKKFEITPATNPGDDTGIGIEPADSGVNPEFTSSSEDEGSGLREQIRIRRELIEGIEAEIRRLRDENRRMQKELDGRRSLPKNNDSKPIEIESSKPE